MLGTDHLPRTSLERFAAPLPANFSALLGINVIITAVTIPAYTVYLGESSNG